jgi:hypothetical protein
MWRTNFDNVSLQPTFVPFVRPERTFVDNAGTGPTLSSFVRISGVSDRGGP